MFHTTSDTISLIQEAKLRTRQSLLHKRHLPCSTLPCQVCVHGPCGTVHANEPPGASRCHKTSPSSWLGYTSIHCIRILTNMAPNQRDEEAGPPANETKDMKPKQGDVHPTGLKFALLMLSVFAAMFLVSLVSISKYHNFQKRLKTVLTSSRIK